MSVDHFAGRADSYDQNPCRVDNVANIAHAILRGVHIDRASHLLDLGSGTGLLLERIAPHAGRITALDASGAMNAQLRAKLPGLGCPVDLVEADVETAPLPGVYDGVISSMTLHHIRDVEALLRKLRAGLKDGGFIAIADLDREDGSFHEEDTGVFHHGFDRGELARWAGAAGFREVQVAAASVVQKPQGDFPVFLLTARR